MPRTKTVVVDAAELEACRTMVRENPGLAALHQVSVEALAPIVPTLPEGWEVDTEMQQCLIIRRTRDGLVVKISLFHQEIMAQTYLGSAEIKGTPLAVVPWMMARFQDLQGSNR